MHNAMCSQPARTTPCETANAKKVRAALANHFKQSGYVTLPSTRISPSVHCTVQVCYFYIQVLRVF